MRLHRLRHAADVAKHTVQRSILGFFALQGAVIAALVIMDTIRKRGRSKRVGFPRPGIFESEVAGSTTTVYTFGEDLYKDMLDQIRNAKHRIMMETYIWKADKVGKEFKAALAEAAERGVKVYVIYDAFANLVVPRSFFRFHPDIHVIRFPVLRPSIIFTNVRGTGLDHRKMLIVDDEVGYVGGYNIGSLYATQWRDTHLKIAGPSVWELRQAFATVWNHYRKRLPELKESNPDFWEPRVRAVNNIPSSLVFPIRGVYLDAIDRASHHIYITMAYFIPDRQILDALLGASRRGVDVRVILPEDSNHVLSDWLSRGFYTALLRDGVTILLYQNAMVHAKTATIDGQWSTVGTANIDRLSLTGNYEINMEIYNDDLARDLETIFEIDSVNSRVLTLEEWAGRRVAARFSESILAPLRPLL
ncbi:phospholipase D-like domain-containing protein [Arthrobacter sp. A5]|uniref:phospholipase D-like domain-containing protein n=1 Tax=Arthrobacter sp. A5 TaxID=576926 RepID=UPI003DA8705F